MTFHNAELHAEFEKMFLKETQASLQSVEYSNCRKQACI